MPESKLVRWYRKFLRLYPRAYREAYAEDMALTFRDVLEEAGQASSLRAFALFVFSIFDVVFLAGVSQFKSLTHSQTNMPTRQIINPVRGFRSFFWTILGICLVLSFLPSAWQPNIASIIEVVMVPYFITVAVLVIRSKRSKAMAIFVSLIGFLFAALLSLSVVQVLDQHGYELLNWVHTIFNVDQEWGFSVLENLFFVAIFLGCSYVTVREIEQPRLHRLWQKLGSLENKGNERKSWITLISTQGLLGILATLCFFLSTHMIFGNGGTWPEGELFNVLSSSYLFFYHSTYGYIAELCALVALIITGLSAWVITSKRLWSTIGIVVVFLAGIIGFSTVTSQYILPHFISVDTGNGLLTSAQQQALDQSCAMRDASYGGGYATDELSSVGIQGTPPPSLNANLCITYTAPHQEGNLYYDGGYGFSLNPESGQVTSIILNAEQLPPFYSSIGSTPEALLFAGWFISFAMPGLTTLLAALLLSRWSKGKSKVAASAKLEEK